MAKTHSEWRDGLTEADQAKYDCETFGCKAAGMAEEINRLSADFIQMVRTFHHYHVNNHKDDSCAQCGLDLRHPVHLRTNISQ